MSRRDADILLVEDDESLGTLLSSRLREEGYSVEYASSAGDALTLLNNASFRLFLFDVGLPDKDGFTLAREIREHSQSPIIFLTAMNSAEYRLEGFEIGAADYIPKPFHLREVILRVGKILPKRSESVMLDKNSLTVTLFNGQAMPLAQRDFELLEYLVSVSPKIVARSEVLEKIFHTDEDISPRVVDNSVLRIRQALGDAGERFLLSVRGQGYQWLP